MSYTMITSIGTGMYNEGYRLSDYIFPDKKSYKTRIFLEAVLECKYRDISTLIL